MRSAMLRTMLVCALALASGHAQTPSPNVTLSGVIQGANGLPASNTVLSFTPSQTFFIVGSGSTPVTGVSSFTGDGRMICNVDSTGDVTNNLCGAPQNSVWAGPASGGTGQPSYQTAPVFSAQNLFSFPTLNQSTTGNAATATNASAIDGVFVSGVASVGNTIVATSATTAVWAPGGSVSNVSAGTTQGVTVNVTNGSTTPNIVIGLGVITPAGIESTDIGMDGVCHSGVDSGQVLFWNAVLPGDSLHFGRTCAAGTPVAATGFFTNTRFLFQVDDTAATTEIGATGINFNALPVIISSGAPVASTTAANTAIPFLIGSTTYYLKVSTTP